MYVHVPTHTHVCTHTHSVMAALADKHTQLSSMLQVSTRSTSDSPLLRHTPIWAGPLILSVAAGVFPFAGLFTIASIDCVIIRASPLARACSRWRQHLGHAVMETQHLAHRVQSIVAAL